MSKTIRNTVARQRILDIIRSNNVAISHAMLQEKMEGSCDRVTIYRVLERLVKEDLIHRIVNINGVVNYAACKICEHTEKHEHQHIHFSCVNCGTVNCITEKPISIELPKNYLPTEYQLTIAGYCPACS